jgi:hypothetical protein|tara:strand:+ start:515 stop:748 length:234 start_codon:yes stop_codon:yes gene_type:complete
MEPHFSASATTQFELSRIAAENIVSQLVFFAMLHQDPIGMSDPDCPIQFKLELGEKSEIPSEAVLLLATSGLEAAEA